ncbi:MAG: (4Fe-4S)-binding protein [Cyclobacteriaceae bacterium]
MKDATKKYSNGEVTIVWKSGLCVHSTRCFKGLGKVFDPKMRPWIRPEGATTEEIIHQVQQCPSGALTYFLNQEKADDR